MPNEKSSSDDLEVYLQDHYAGGAGALELLEHLSKVHEKDSLGAFFTQLYADVKTDHERLHDLIKALGFEASAVRNAGAWMAEKFSRAKLGLSASDSTLSLLQALETLYVGITGKRLLWRGLVATRGIVPSIGEIDLVELEKRAIEQLERVEARRLIAARGCFSAK